MIDVNCFSKCFDQPESFAMSNVIIELNYFCTNPITFY